MKVNENGQSVIDIECFCADKGCCGNLRIQPDMVDGRRVFMVEVVGSDGCESAYMWISVVHLEQLKSELSVLIDEFDKGK
jgi:hypothetical protein